MACPSNVISLKALEGESRSGIYYTNYALIVLKLGVLSGCMYPGVGSLPSSLGLPFPNGKLC
jgi:hypothetical protein